MRSVLILLSLAACCPIPAQMIDPEPERSPKMLVEPPALGELAGRYEQGASRLCILAGRRTHRFALVIRAAGTASCSGSGTVLRAGSALRFRMRGDSICSWEGKIEGRTIRFPSRIDPGCAYYCGGGATLAGVSLAQRGTGRAEAMQAKDLVGEPLCTGE